MKRVFITESIATLPPFGDFSRFQANERLRRTSFPISSYRFRLSAFSKAELRVTNPFELPPVRGGGGGVNYDAASGKISIISKCFQRSKQELKKILRP